MGSGKLSYAGIAGAVAGVVGVLGSVSVWYAFVVSDLGIAVKGTGVSAGKLALAMSIALFAFSAAYVAMSDARIRRAMAALVIITSVTLTLAFVWGMKNAGGAGIGWGLWLTGLGGVLGIAAGLQAMKESPLGDDLEDAHVEAAPAEPVTDPPGTPIAS
jgi:hypothetical protein